MITPIQAQAEEKSLQNFIFISPVTEIVYSRNSPAFGAGLMIGAGDDVSIGLKAVYFIDLESVHALEMGAFIRFYLFGTNNAEGLFVQLNGGAVVFTREEAVNLPTDIGTASVFLTVGWRFHFGQRFFVEPVVRAGTPFLLGAGVSAGVRL